MKKSKPKTREPIHSRVYWKWDGKDYFSRITNFSDGSILYEPITKRQYYKEKGY